MLNSSGPLVVERMFINSGLPEEQADRIINAPAAPSIAPRVTAAVILRP